MTPDAVPQAPFDDVPPPFACSWSPTGVDAAHVVVSGELDLASAGDLDQALRTALAHARLVLLDLRGVSFLDCAGVHVVVDASLRSRVARRRLVVDRVRDGIDIFALTGTDAQLEFFDPGSASATVPAQVPGNPERSIRPLDNPVNASVVVARVMAIPDWQLWLHADDGLVQRAWAPPGTAESVPPHAPVELYLDGRGAVNGWRDPASGLAINQRHLDPAAPPAFAEPMVCQGPCGVVWQAPSAALLAEFDEQCLTCAGPLAPG